MLVKILSDGTLIETSWGSFDQWCIFISKNGKNRHAPLDKNYFRVLKAFYKEFGYKVYEEFITIYDLTTKEYDPNILTLINEFSLKYEKYATKYELIFIILYLGMLAEENKANTKLGKRIKRLGVYQTLLEDYAPKCAANCTRGTGWDEIDYECNKRGF